MVKICIPFEYSGSRITGVELKKPVPGDLKMMKKESDRGYHYHTIYELLSASIVGTVPETGDVRKMCRQLPYRVAEILTLKVLADLLGDNRFEGYYVCPRCGHTLVNERYSAEDDRRESLDDIPVCWAPEDISGQFEIGLSNPIRIEVTSFSGESRDVTINSITMRNPTMQDGMDDEQKGSDDNDFGMMFNAIVALNGEDFEDKTYRAVLRGKIFEKMDFDDLKTIRDKVTEYGMDYHIEKICPKCKKRWKAPVNTSGFFVSALDQV